MKESSKKEMYSWIRSLVFAFLIAIVIRQFLFTPIVVLGQSMEPTFHHANKVIVSKVEKISHFDMIVFRASDSKENYIKRVIGMPGDHVVMEDDKLFINGKEYEENYVNTKGANVFEGQKVTEDFDVQVPAGQLFVLGDNRRKSIDSRKIGSINEDSVIGVVKLRVSPINEIGVPK